MKNFKAALHAALDEAIEKTVEEVDTFDHDNPGAPEELSILSVLVSDLIYKGLQTVGRVNDMDAVRDTLNIFLLGVLAEYVDRPCECSNCMPRH